MALLFLLAEGDLKEVIPKKLRELEVLGLVKDGKLTTKGEEFLTTTVGKPIVLKGKVVTGDGEGQYYLSLKGYRDQVREKLGFDPYPGTLNVLLDPESTERRSLLLFRKAIVLKGFEEGGRRYGEVLAYPAQVSGFWPSALIVPLKTHHPPSIIEIIAPVKLRNELRLKDGDEVTVRVY